MSTPGRARSRSSGAMSTRRSRSRRATAASASTSATASRPRSEGGWCSRSCPSSNRRRCWRECRGSSSWAAPISSLRGCSGRRTQELSASSIKLRCRRASTSGSSSTSWSGWGRRQPPRWSGTRSQSSRFRSSLAQLLRQFEDRRGRGGPPPKSSGVVNCRTSDHRVGFSDVANRFRSGPTTIEQLPTALARSRWRCGSTRGPRCSPCRTAACPCRWCRRSRGWTRSPRSPWRSACDRR